MRIDEQKIQIDKLEWFYREAKPVNETDNPPVLLLHGLPSQSYSWTEVMRSLAEQGFHAIAPDWIGFGFSTKPEKRDFAYTPAAFLEALSQFIAALKIESCYLVIQGFLGSVGVQYALKNPEKVQRLVIRNAPIVTSAKLPWKIQQLGLPFVGDMMTQDPLVIDRTLESGSRFAISDQDLDIYRRPFLKSSDAGRALLNVVRNLQLSQTIPEIESGLKQWENPTLIIWGNADPWLSSAPVQQLSNSLTNAEFVNLPEAGHYPQEHWSENVSNAILPFLRRKN